jgi:hypothetical protein
MNGKTQVKEYIRALEKEDGSITTNGFDIANELNSFFSSVFIKENTNLPEFKINCEISCPVFNIKTVNEKLGKLNVNKSTGVDKVHPRVLKECA